MDAFGLTVLILVLAALMVRWVALAPLLATLGVCFGNWAEESRSFGSPSIRA